MEFLGHTHLRLVFFSFFSQICDICVAALLSSFTAAFIIAACFCIYSREGLGFFNTVLWVHSYRDSELEFKIKHICHPKGGEIEGLESCGRSHKLTAQLGPLLIYLLFYLQ